MAKIRTLVLASVALLTTVGTSSDFCLRPLIAATPSRADFVIADGAQTPESVPDSVVWRVFCLGLSLTPQREGLVGQLGLTEQELDALSLNANAYVSEWERIDADVRAYVDQKYGTDRKPPEGFKRAPYRDASVLPTRPIVLPRGVRSLREELERTGYLAQMEGKQREAFGRFDQALRASLPRDTFDRIQQWVTRELVKSIRIIDRGVTVDAVDRSPVGNGYWRPKN